LIEWPDILFANDKNNNEHDNDDNPKDDDDDDDDYRKDTTVLPNPNHRLDITITIPPSRTPRRSGMIQNEKTKDSKLHVDNNDDEKVSENTDVGEEDDDDEEESIPRIVTLAIPAGSSWNGDEDSSSSLSTWTDRLQTLVDDGLVEDWLVVESSS
jgi:hypothetical protein